MNRARGRRLQTCGEQESTKAGNALVQPAAVYDNQENRCWHANFTADINVPWPKLSTKKNGRKEDHVGAGPQVTTIACRHWPGESTAARLRCMVTWTGGGKTCPAIRRSSHKEAVTVAWGSAQIRHQSDASALRAGRTVYQDSTLVPWS
jgi:hypothetical protein